MDKAKIPVILAILTWLVVCSYKHAQAVSLTLSGPSTWAIGGLEAGQSSTSPNSPNTWTVTNDSGVGEKINIQVTGSTPSGWVAACDAYGCPSTPGANQYVLKALPLNQQVYAGAPLALASLVGGASAAFGLQFTTPTSGGERIQQTLTLTLTAVDPCTTRYGANCWRKLNQGESCTTVCSSYGGCITTSFTYAEGSYALTSALGCPYGHRSECGGAYAPYRSSSTNWCYAGPCTIDCGAAASNAYRVCPCNY